ncbi:hypothetical protein [Burkholderia gladioli]|uniref:hypothetical protein n=1 Tax=Burkholderia gladioli TaxID=28095 RepID=UPI00163E1E28|nr:hypothetical protein [Burkholderia gladioli]
MSDDAQFWRNLLAAMTREIDDGEYGQPWRGTENAPGHAHDVPGVWDTDNGSKAGKPCAWCMTWNRARAALAASPAPAIPTVDAAEIIEQCAVRAATHSQYPVETDFDHGYAKARRDAAHSIRALKAALAIPESEWQPIETVPKDGTEVALLFADEVTVLGKRRPRVRAASWLGDWTIPYHRDNPPIGWMHMPAAPGGAARDGGGS